MIRNFFVLIQLCSLSLLLGLEACTSWPETENVEEINNYKSPGIHPLEDPEYRRLFSIAKSRKVVWEPNCNSAGHGLGSCELVGNDWAFIKEKFLFDQKGQVVEEWRFLSEGPLISRFEFRYDSLGRMIEKLDLSYQAEERTWYSYNSSGQLLEMRTCSERSGQFDWAQPEGLISFFYNESGEKVRKVDQKMHEYSFGKLDTVEDSDFFYGKRGELLRKITNSKDLFWEWTYQYGNDGLLEKIEEYQLDDFGGKLKREESDLKYNEKSILVGLMLRYFGKDGEETSSIRLVYGYGSNGILLKESRFWKYKENVIQAVSHYVYDFY